MSKPKEASLDQLSLAAFSQGNIVTLDGGKRIRLDDKVDFWPATGRWHALESEAQGDGVGTLLDFLIQLRETSGQSVSGPEPVATRRKVDCNYCGKPAQLHTGAAVYPDRADLVDRLFWVCWPCDAWVRCESGGDGHRPLGTLANEELRHARRAAHAAFDPLWKEGDMARGEAYEWLADALGMPRDRCHIGAMSVEQCLQVREAVDKLEATRATMANMEGAAAQPSPGVASRKTRDDDELSIGDFWRGVREADKAQRAQDTTDNTQLLARAGIPFQSKNFGSHLIVAAHDVTVDYWPSSDLWMVRGQTKRRYGVSALVAFVNSRKAAAS